LGAKFNEELTNVKGVCRFPRGNEKNTGATLKEFKERLYCYVIFIKSTVYVYRTTFCNIILTFLGEGGGRLVEVVRLFNIFGLKRGAYSDPSIYGS